MVDTYQTTTTKTAKVEVVKLKSFVRLVIYGGAKKQVIIQPLSSHQKM